MRIVSRVFVSVFCALSLFTCLPSSATAALTPLNDNTEFVKQVYRDFLNREADQEGLNYWTEQLSTGARTRASVVEQYLLSPEFQDKVAPVVRLYFAYFNRLPDYGGLMYWVNEYVSGNRSLDNISDAFAGSLEFQTTYGSLDNGEFVQLVYQNVLGRDPEPDGFEFWTSELNAAQRTRGQVMTGFSESPEYQQLTANRVYVTMTYIGLLRRAPEQGGYEYWVDAMDLGESGLGLIDAFLQSDEYASRFVDDGDIDIDGDGYTENQGDCNDSDATIHPGATEICEDFIDQDCDGSDDACPVRTLTIDVLGDGQVTSSSDSTLDCVTNCEFDYPQGQTITLEAAALGSAAFSHWTGCDYATDTTCTVMLDGDRHVSPSFAKTVVLQPGVVELDAEAMALLLAQTETSLTFSSSILGLVTFVPGDVLVSNVVTEVAEGLLRRVEAIEESNNQLLVTTTPAAIEDVIQEGTVVSRTVLTPENTTVNLLAEGMQVAPMAVVGTGFTFTLNEVLLDDDDDPSTTDDQLKLTGSFTTEIQVDADLDVSLLTGVNAFKLIMESKTTDQLTVSSSGTLGEKEMKKTLATYTLAPIMFGPVAILPEVALIVRAKASVAAGVSASVEISQEVVGGVVYRKESGWAPVSSYRRDFDYTPPTAQVTVGAKASVGPELTTKIYGVAGPKISLTGFLGLKGGIADLGGSNASWCSLSAGITASAGAKLGISRWTLAEANFTLLEYEKDLFSCDQGQLPDNTDPYPPTDLTIATLLPTTAFLTWGEALDNVAVKGYEVFQDGIRIANDVGSTGYKVMRLQAETEYCFKVRAFDAAGNRSPYSNQLCTTTPDTTGETGGTYTMSGTIHAGSTAGPVLPGASVSIAGKTVTSSLYGTFQISGIPAGTYTMTVSKAGYATYTNPAYYVGSSQSDLHFWLTATGSTTSTLPDTGQTLCYDSIGTVINCAGTGQDGEFSINPMSYTDQGNGTVKDNVTGLIWQKEDDNTTRTWQGALDYCSNLALGGSSNWRLPNTNELMGIVDYSVPYPGPTIHPVFIGTNESFYWSSSSSASDPVSAWSVSFYYGSVGDGNKSYYGYARCVR